MNPRILGAATAVATVLISTLVTSGAGTTTRGAAPQPTLAGSSGPAPWLAHLRRHPDSALSATLREVLPPAVAPPAAAARAGQPASTSSTRDRDRSGNLQVTTDSEPPVRQSNPAVAASLRSRGVAVGAVVDAVGASYQIVRTADGGRTWSSVRQPPQLPTGAQCPARIPSVAYSRRDDAFYLSAACLTPEGASVVQVWRSSDDGETWTPPLYAALAASNLSETGEPDLGLLHDWPRVAVDNSRSSPHFGRLYLTWTTYHVADSGDVDHCPAQVAWTDEVAPVPSDTTFTTTSIGPDRPDGGFGPFTAAWNRVAVQPDGTVLVAYAQEGCNTGVDDHLRVARSTDGGASFGAPVQVDRPGEFADNPDPDDVLPGKSASLGISPSLAVDPRSGRVALAYQNNVTAARSGADVWVSTSRDGLTWRGRPASTARGGAPAPRDQFFASVAADERGRFHLLWLDNRRDPANHLIDAWGGQSRDGARTWTTRRISSRSYDPDRTLNGGGSSLGTSTALAAALGWAYPLWPDARDNAVDVTGLGDLDVFTDVTRVR